MFSEGYGSTVRLHDRAAIWTQQTKARTQLLTVALPVVYVLLTS